MVALAAGFAHGLQGQRNAHSATAVPGPGASEGPFGRTRLPAIP